MHPGDGRRQRRRIRPRVLLVALLCVVTAIVAVVVVRAAQRPSGSRHAGRRPASTAAPAPRTATGPTTHPADAAPPTQPVRPQPTHTAARSVHTPQGLWWGVDSTAPITAAALANVRQWYRGAPRPQFWGRYLRGRYGVSRAELAYARRQRLYVYLLVTDRNCSGCGGGDVCGNDRTAAQAAADARAAVRAAHRLRLPQRTTLFKDIEQVAACRGEPTSTYLLGWYHAIGRTGYRTAFYGNVHRQSYDFPVAYCHALAHDPTLGEKVTLAMNEDEPRIGAPRGSTGPRNAPPFHPNSPSCAPPTATAIWQYGESLTPANLTDIDQARSDTPGLLAPDGTATP